MTFNTTSSSVVAATTTTSEDKTQESTSLESLSVTDDEKYYKRWQQQQIVLQQRQKWILFFSITAFILTFTVRSWDNNNPKEVSPYQNVYERNKQITLEIPSRILRQSDNKQDINLQIIDQNNNNNNSNNNNNNNGIEIGMKKLQLKGSKSMNTKKENSETNQRNPRFVVGSNFDNKHLREMLEDLENNMIENRKGGIRWIRPHLLVSMDPSTPNLALESLSSERLNYLKKKNKIRQFKKYFNVNRNDLGPMVWESELEAIHYSPPNVDYTVHSYEYPPLQMEPPKVGSSYPKLIPFKQLMNEWPQDDVDHPPIPYTETLIHFDYSNLKERDAATRFRKAKLPFKVYNIPEIDNCSTKWTDEYVSTKIDQPKNSRGKPPVGKVQESPNNFFAFFQESQWDIHQMGVPPVRDNDWTFSTWAQHALYADTIGLQSDQPHFYYQAGTSKEEPKQSKSEQSFISQDLPSFSSTSKNFFLFHPSNQQGIQCRFGERGVTAAIHFDAGRNMVAMITGAKRYILSPPNQCGKLGIVTNSNNTIYRHSMLNFGHLSYLDNTTSRTDSTIEQQSENLGMSIEERAWLERASEALVVETVLKAGEVLYIPSHWFHYITSLQKSTQCNVRSGSDVIGDNEFGGREHVLGQCVPW